MIGKLFRGLAALIVYFSVGTVIAAGVIAGVAWNSGRITPEKLERISEVINEPPGEAKEKPPPEPDPLDELTVPWEELAMARALASRDFELREQTLDGVRRQLDLQQEKLRTQRVEQEQFAKALRAEAESSKSDDEQLRAQTARSFLEGMRPQQAKDQIMRMIAAGDSKEVVRMLTEMTMSKRSKIINEFKTAEEAEKLADILRLIREGESEAAPSAESESAATSSPQTSKPEAPRVGP